MSVLALAFGLAALNASMAGPRIQVTTWANPDDALALTVSSDAEHQCRLEVKADHGREKPEKVNCHFTLPAGARVIHVAGTSSGRDPRSRLAWDWKVDQVWKIVDAGPAIAPLHGSEPDFGKRVLAFVAAETAYGKRRERGYALLEANPGKVAQADIEAAERRLGFALPSEFKSLLAATTQLQNGDNYTTRIADLKSTYEMMVHDWGASREDLESSKSVAFKTFYESSTILFTEVGDGLGGLLFQPAPVKACDGAAAYFWLHQDHGRPELLRDGDGKCVDFPGAFNWLMQRFVLAGYADDVTADEVVIDTSAPVVPVSLYVSADEKAPVIIRTYGD